MATVEGNYKQFNVQDFIKLRFPVLWGEDPNFISDFLLRCLANFFTVVSGDGLKILDYGCGPSIPYSISAASKASDIILADYADPNREYLKKWLAKDPSLQDWSPYFKYVVQTLERESKEHAIKREEMLRNKVKAVVSCDITKEEFIEEAHNKKGWYDIVIAMQLVSRVLQGPSILPTCYEQPCISTQRWATYFSVLLEERVVIVRKEISFLMVSSIVIWF